MAADPIAIVGRGCVLPDALTPESLWRNVRDGVSSIGPPAPGGWGLPEGAAVAEAGGFVRGFGAVFDPAGFRLPAAEIAPLGPVFQWVLHAVREALRECGESGDRLSRGGLVLGNLSYPTVNAVRWATGVWLPDGRTPRVDPRERFFSAMPAQLVAEALGLGLGGFALDAACASSLYALALACARLWQGSADLMLAGGVTAADPVFLHRGFQALSALSATGRSRPFHRDADGLVPAEGAAVVALMRLADARAAGVPVLGVIRGIGLSNDGAAGGLLGPSGHGQERAMRHAYASAALDPATVSLVECHATGTVVGDGTEIRSIARIFADRRDLAVGSVKSNLGHALAAAGMAGLLKVIAALRAGVRPPTLHAEEPTAALSGTVLRPVLEAEPWPGPRRAAVSAFGFGGANAHVIVDAGDDVAEHGVQPTGVGGTGTEDIALVALAVRAGVSGDTSAFRARLVRGERADGPREAIEIDPAVLRFPPADLADTLGQHLLVLDAAVEAAQAIDLPSARTAVIIGMAGDLEAARHGVSWRHDVASDGVGPLTAARVTGTMPNLVANRICAQLDLGGAGFTVSAEEASGLVALDLAARALCERECDAAIVGAVDLSHEPAHRAAAAALKRPDRPGDAAVVLVLKRLADARRDGDPVLALVAADHEGTERPALTVGDLARPGTPHLDPTTLFGRPHAAVGLLAVAAAVTALRHRLTPTADGRLAPGAAPADAEVAVRVLGAAPHRVRLRAGRTDRWSTLPAPRLAIFSGGDREEVVDRARTGRESGDGPARLAVVTHGADQAVRRACEWLEGRGPRPSGAAYRDRPVGGDVAFVYPNGSAAYPGMGRELVLALPELIDGVRLRYGVSAVIGDRFDAVGRIVSVALLAFVHTELTTCLLRLRPAACIGYSSGESTALVAMRAWPDAAGLLHRIRTDPLLTHELAGEQLAVRRYWARQGMTGRRWATHLVHAPVDRVRVALADERAVHLMTVNAPDVCVVGGEENACRDWLVRFGPEAAIPVDHSVVAHAPEVAEVSRQWWDFHHLPTEPVPGVRFYRGVDGTAYTPTADRASRAITDMAVGTVDFAAVVERAHGDGVRVFVEHGPRGSCTGWIRRTLAGRDHLAVCLDAPGDAALPRLCTSVAELVAAGVPVDHEALFSLLAQAAPTPVPTAHTIAVRAHPVGVTGAPAGTTAMPPAPAVPVPTWAVTTAARSTTKAPLFTRAQLEHLATGRISDLFGPRFVGQDGYRRQTRLPAPPMLLVDRVIDIDAPAARLAEGSISTETEVRTGAWYLDAAGRMAAGALIEAGQADLLLISWMGVDMLVGDERVYRLLGCEVTFHGPLPVPGETLRYVNHIDGHAEHEGARLFFFRYACHVGDELRLSMRGGQAGFFTDAELAASAGIQWDPQADPPEPARVDPPAIRGARRHYDATAVRAFAAGDPAACFGTGWDVARAHVRTPRIPTDRLLLLDTVEEFDPEGGPWGRGYLLARTPVAESDWFFAGHFLGDPCMPGTLMLEGGLQAMAFYLAALGHTVDRDGWRFEPELHRPFPMRCRGQVVPSSRTLTYEVFVVSVTASPVPAVVADVLCSVDGLSAFHARRVGLRLVPDWPLEHWRRLGPCREQTTGEPVPLADLGGLVGYREPRPVAVLDGLPVDRRALLASAWGRPADAFGPRFALFDGIRRCPRLPGPPYQFLSRVVAVDGPFAGMRPGSRVSAEYDVPGEAWYFEQNTWPVLPFAVLVEVALQPCGWLATYVGSPLDRAGDLLFRNLDGECTVLGEVGPRTGVLRTEVELRATSEHGGMIIQSFAVECFADGVPVLVLHTTFGFFPPSAFAERVGLPVSEDDLRRLAEPGGAVVRACAPRPPGLPPVPGPMLRMLDRVTGYWPTGGARGLGRLRAEKDIDAGAWFFRAHFFQDPVQPGSLGLEAVCQLLQHYLVVSGQAGGARFETVMSDAPVSWKYRGQVEPGDRVVTVELDIVESGVGERGPYAVGEAWLWVNDTRIYHFPRIGVRAVPEPRYVEVFDPAVDRWMTDHRPTWTIPVVSLMSVVDALARAVAEHTGAPVSALRDVRLHRWLVVEEPLTTSTRVTQVEGGWAVALATTPRGDEKPRHAPAAEGVVEVGEPSDAPPPPFAPLPDARPAPDPYAGGELFHGGSFHYLVEHRVGAMGASGTLDAGAGEVPRGQLHQGLLDGALHVIPHQSLWQWSDRIERGWVSVPHRLEELRVFEPLPDAGRVGVEARFAGFADDGNRLPRVAIQILVAERVAVSMVLTLVMLPLGRLGTLSPSARRAFMRDHLFQDRVGLSATDADATRLHVDEALAVDWLPGTIAAIYGLLPPVDIARRLGEIAAKDHVGALTGEHPAAVVVDEHLRVAYPADRPWERYEIEVVRNGGVITVRSGAVPAAGAVAPDESDVQ